MPELEQLRAGHAPAVLAFELVNRAYFAASISDRGDEFFDQFPDRYSALLAEQEAGICAFYVLVADDGSILGRFNLYDLKDGTATLGYRVAQQVMKGYRPAPDNWPTQFRPRVLLESRRRFEEIVADRLSPSSRAELDELVQAGHANDAAVKRFEEYLELTANS